jgi:hypothetical protein
MVLIWESFYVILLDGVVKIIRRILDKIEFVVCTWQRLESRFLLSHGRFEWSLGLRIFHTICRVGQQPNSTNSTIRIRT